MTITPEQLAEFTPRELDLATKWRTHRFGEMCIEELLREYRQDFERQIACGRDRARVLADRLTARDEHCDNLEATIATLTAERDALCAAMREDNAYAECTFALGIAYEPEQGASHPGPLDAVLAEIARLKQEASAAFELRERVAACLDSLVPGRRAAEEMGRSELEAVANMQAARIAELEAEWDHKQWGLSVLESCRAQGRAEERAAVVKTIRREGLPAHAWILADSFERGEHVAKGRDVDSAEIERDIKTQREEDVREESSERMHGLVANGPREGGGE